VQHHRCEYMRMPSGQVCVDAARQALISARIVGKRRRLWNHLRGSSVQPKRVACPAIVRFRSPSPCSSLCRLQSPRPTLA
jgi:hypothetical protein